MVVIDRFQCKLYWYPVKGDVLTWLNSGPQEIVPVMVMTVTCPTRLCRTSPLSNPLCTASFWRNINIYSHCRSVLRRLLQFTIYEDNHTYTLHAQYHTYWWSGDAKNQGISRKGIDQASIIPGSIRRFHFPGQWCFMAFFRPTLWSNHRQRPPDLFHFRGLRVRELGEKMT